MQPIIFYAVLLKMELDTLFGYKINDKTLRYLGVSREVSNVFIFRQRHVSAEINNKT